MVQYSSIRFWNDPAIKRRAIDRLIDLRGALYKEVKSKRDEGSILLASWNLRDFDDNKFGHGPRLDESYLYIAEIISAFDLIALQEVNRNLKPLEKLIDRLGRRDWDYIVTDITEGNSGNQERMAYVYNKHKVSFGRMAGEVVLPGTKDRQLARTPFLASFQAGWFKFNLCTVHMYFGSNAEGKKRRVQEIADLAKFINGRQKKEMEDYILLGDFNIVSTTDDTMKALTKHQFKVHEDIMSVGTTLKGKNPYDQIALKVKNKMFEMGDAGVFDFEEHVFREEDHEAYRVPEITSKMPKGLITPEKENKYVKTVRKRRAKTAEKNNKPFNWSEADIARERKNYYLKVWRSFQVSDHKPIWVELKVDFTTDYLKSLKPKEEPLAIFSDDEGA